MQKCLCIIQMLPILSKSIKQFVSFKLLLISKSIAQWVLSTKIKHHDLRMGIFRQHNLSLFQI